MNIVIAVAATFVAAGALNAQTMDPLSIDAKQAYEKVKSNILASAEKMPEENYSFRPAPRVRTFGQILGHLAEEQYIYCGAVKGEQKAVDAEKTKPLKADLMAVLREAYAYCDAAYNGLTDATAVQMVRRGQGERTKLGILWRNTIHNESHYGNLVTYMRIKGLTPPSTEGQ